MREQTRPGAYLGAVAVVQHKGRTVFQQAFGQRDLARQSAMTPDAIFRIYSMSKPIASAALLLLMEEGRLTLDDPIAQHLPEFAAIQVWAGGSLDSPMLRPPSRFPTVRNLLTHTTGFATRSTDAAQPLLDAAAPWMAASLKDYASRVAGVPLAAEPGARFAYDGVNTEVLARVIEVISGEPFEQFLKRRIFSPLRMQDTGFFVPPSQRQRIAGLSTVGIDGSLVAAPGPSSVQPGQPLNAYPSGAGGLYATAADYMRFASMLLQGGKLDGQRILGRKTVEWMTTQQLSHLYPIEGLAPGEGFGLGVSVVVDPARRGRLSSAGAYGWSGASTTYFTIDPKEQMIALLLMQHLPGESKSFELPKPGLRFFNLVYQALE